MKIDYEKERIFMYIKKVFNKNVEPVEVHNRVHF